MQLTLLKSKIHRAMVTGVHPDYSGSLTVDSELLAEVGLLPHEKILVANLDNDWQLNSADIDTALGALEALGEQ